MNTRTLKPCSRQIVSLNKIHGISELLNKIIHNSRTKQPRNADPAKASSNKLGVIDSMQPNRESIDSRIAVIMGQKKLRKNGVLAIEIVFGAPEKHSEKSTPVQIVEAESNSIAWANGLIPNNPPVRLDFHHDELAWHGHGIWLMIANGVHVCADTIDQAFFYRMHDSFNDSVGCKLGLTKGVRGSRASHIELKDFYASLRAPMPSLVVSPSAIPEPPMLFLTQEKMDQYRESVAYAVSIQLHKKDAKILTDKARGFEIASRQVAEMAATIQAKDHVIKNLGQDITEISNKKDEMIAQLTGEMVQLRAKLEEFQRPAITPANFLDVIHVQRATSAPQNEYIAAGNQACTVSENGNAIVGESTFDDHNILEFAERFTGLSPDIIICILTEKFGVKAASRAWEQYRAKHPLTKMPMALPKMDKERLTLKLERSQAPANELALAKTLAKNGSLFVDCDDSFIFVKEDGNGAASGYICNRHHAKGRTTFAIGRNDLPFVAGSKLAPLVVLVAAPATALKIAAIAPEKICAACTFTDQEPTEFLDLAVRRGAKIIALGSTADPLFAKQVEWVRARLAQAVPVVDFGDVAKIAGGFEQKPSPTVSRPTYSIEIDSLPGGVR